MAESGPSDQPVAAESSPKPTGRHPSRARRDSTASVVSRQIRRLSQEFEDSNPPEGFFAAAADFASSLVVGASEKIPFASGTTAQAAGKSEKSAGAKAQEKAGDGAGTHITAQSSGEPETASKTLSSDAATLDVLRDTDNDLYKPFDNGYHFPPKYSAGESFRHGTVAFWKYFITPLGFGVVIYGLNVVAWGGMLFLLLCNASPAMCYPSCEDIDSPRRKWIEWDSQILNALFCVTGFGLAPWRFRDMFFLLKFRLTKDYTALRRLAGIHRGWFRLQGSQNLPIDVGPDNLSDSVPRDAIPFPERKTPDAPLTGMRAPPTRMWKLDFILWMNVSNTFLQCVLCGFMWGMNRYTRPSWATGLFVGLGCVAGAVGGLGMFLEGKTVKGIEGVPLTDEDKKKLVCDGEQGVYHYNNVKGKKPKEKVPDPEANTEKGV